MEDHMVNIRPLPREPIRKPILPRLGRRVGWSSSWDACYSARLAMILYIPSPGWSLARAEQIHNLGAGFSRFLSPATSAGCTRFLHTSPRSMHRPTMHHTVVRSSPRRQPSTLQRRYIPGRRNHTSRTRVHRSSCAIGAKDDPILDPPSHPNLAWRHDPVHPARLIPVAHSSAARLFGPPTP